MSFYLVERQLLQQGKKVILYLFIYFYTILISWSSPLSIYFYLVSLVCLYTYLFYFNVALFYEQEIHVLLIFKLV